MKAIKLTLMTVLISLGTAFGQDINAKDVPSVILNKFQKSHPKAYGIEWEMDGANYKVEFETGTAGKDHKIWYNASGEIIREKQELTKAELPQEITSKLNKEYSGYKVDDAEKITEGGKVVYVVELDSFTKDWKITFDSKGNIISKIED